MIQFRFAIRMSSDLIPVFVTGKKFFPNLLVLKDFLDHFFNSGSVPTDRWWFTGMLLLPPSEPVWAAGLIFTRDLSLLPHTPQEIDLKGAHESLGGEGLPIQSLDGTSTQPLLCPNKSTCPNFKDLRLA